MSLRDGLRFTLWRQSTRSGRFHILGYDGEDVRRDTVPILDASIHWNEVSVWLNTTVEAKKVGLSNHTLQRLKVIDVQHDHVIYAPAHCRYLALSYVFGNVKKIQVPPSGSFDRHQLPATIRDALIACQKMGFRFLWVDQLCINQQDQTEVQEQIDQMNHIYRNAACTLVAQAGENSLYGLPGVSKRREWEQITLQLYDDTIVQLSQPLATCMQQTRWASRGWTFQEEMFSQKLICFTDCGLVYLDKGLYYPRLISEKLGDSTAWASYYSLDSYFSTLDRYTARSLTFVSDKIRAFTAILNEHYGQGNHHYGIPLQQIDRAMLWHPYSIGRRQLTQIEREFPSWSWASHPGEIRHLPSAAPLAIWAKAEIIESTVNMRVSKPAPDTKWEASYELQRREIIPCICAAWEAGCIGSPFPGDINLCTATVSRLMTIWPTYDSYWEGAFGPQLHNGLFTIDHIRLPSSIDRLLMVHCQVAYFSVHYPDGKPLNQFSRWPFCIRSSGGSLVGAIWIAEYFKTPSSPWKGEFLLLSVSKNPHFDLDLALDAENDDHDFLDILPRNERGQLPDPNFPAYAKFMGVNVVNVMLIGRSTNDGIARRIGVGQIFLKRWAEAERQFKTVVLE
ncbi:HET-domain-containing protein [Aspergillus sclerotioniger CBS 115572]|uniref:HET-domain-containing protein n=1 Tax=Aspergillus sclerotioniger CBS 115572 TaxID=1450535 RepID=A0A317VD76_9EURO|nr:HET-domain-containing protein [Aspergillus sclerotioniger CBS 115572]PWY70842.1 HET-domain-containing protein [Aspergillus sclerotioniger CBS 115572]